MTVFLWIVQGLLAAMFLLAGITKTTKPRDKLTGQLPWANDFSTPVLRLIGAAEFAAALGLVLPAVTGIATVLTPLAATGLAVIMLGAMAVHTRRKEPGAVAFNAILLAAMVFVAWGRFGPYAF